MTIEFTCNCGKKLSVPDDVAGRRAKCPTCGAVVNVPGAAAPPSDEAEQGSKVDQVVDQLGEDFARSKERAPRLTQIAVALAIWAAVSLFLAFLVTLVNPYFTFILWILAWLPQSAAGGLIAVGIIKADRRTLTFVRLAAPVIVGASWVALWISAVPSDGRISAGIMSLVCLGNLAAYGLLYWYFRREDTLLLFPAEVEQAEIAEDESQPAGGVEGN